MRLTHFCLLIALLATSLMACKNEERSASMQGDVPSDFLVIFGQQGITAGQGMGYTISGAGEVSRWQGKHPGETTIATAAVNASAVQDLWKRVQDIGFLEMSDQAMATSYTFITVTGGGESRRVTWVKRDEEAPTAAQDLYEKCLDVAEAALQAAKERG